MSQICTLKKPNIPVLRFNADVTTLEQLVSFVWHFDVTVQANASGVALVFPTENPDVQEVIELADEDHILLFAGEVEVFEEETYHLYFQ